MKRNVQATFAKIIYNDFKKPNPGIQSTLFFIDMKPEIHIYIYLLFKYKIHIVIIALLVHV